MSLQPTLSAHLDGFLITTANRISATFFGNTRQLVLPAKVQQAREDNRLVQLQAQYLQRKASRQRELAILQAEPSSLAPELQRQLESVAATPDDLENRIQHLQASDLRDRRVVSKLQRTLMHELQAGEIQQKLQDIQAIWDRGGNWPSTLSREETEKILLDGREQQRLLMLVSPPDISEDCPESFRNNLEKDIRNGLKGFMAEHYALDSPVRPVEFYGKYFNRSIFDVEVKQLETFLAPVPTAILYSDISDYEVHFHVGFWGLQHNTVSLIPIQAWNWEQAKEALEAEGKDEKQSLRLIRQLIVTVHKLLAAFLSDLYYLNIDSYYEPQLFHLGAEFDQEEFSTLWIQPYIEILADIQQKQLAAYEGDRRVAMLPQSGHGESKRPLPSEAERQQRLRTIQDTESTLLQNADTQRHLKTEAEQKRRQAAAQFKTLTWKCVRTLSGQASPVDAIALLPNQSTLISASTTARAEEMIKVWDWQTGNLLRTVPSRINTADAISLNPLQNLSAVVADSSISVIQIETGQQIASLSGSHPVAFSPDGKLIASSQMAFEEGGFKHWIEVWNLETNTRLCKLTKHTEYFRVISFSPDGEFLAAGSEDNTVLIWHLSNQHLLYTLTGHTEPLLSVAFSPDGWMLATGGEDSSIMIWNLQTGTLTCTLKGHAAPVSSLAFHSVQECLASGSRDNTIKLWSLVSEGSLLSQELLSTLSGHFGAVYALGFSGDGQALISGSTDTCIKVWQCR